jgi:hypothetical protein
MMFPERELEVIRLAQDLVKGLADHNEDFPAPPFSAEEIGQRLTAYDAARQSAKAGEASASKGYVLKDQALHAVIEAVKADIKYAESMARGNEAKLQDLGWGARRARTVNGEVPGQVVTLEIVEEGKTWLTLSWKQPFDGGPAQAYRVQRRKTGGDWLDVGTSLGTQLRLNGQDAGTEFEYQVLAINKAGAGPASNIVRAVL